MGRLQPRPHHLPLLLLGLGLIPAFIIVLFLRLQDGQLVVGGTELGEYSAPRLLAGVISTALPLLLLLPLLLVTVRERLAPWLLACAGAPLAAFLPALLAALLIGGSGFGQALMALLVLCLLSACLCLWVVLLSRLLTPQWTVPLYGSLWAISQFTAYLNEYVAPYMELKALGLVKVVIWIIPQMQGMPNAVDNWLQGGTAPWPTLWPTVLQLIILAGITTYLDQRGKKDHQIS